VGDEAWAGSIWGVSRYRDGQWEVFRREVPGGSTYAMLADTKGGLWIAGGRGMVFRGPDGKWRTFTAVNSGLGCDIVLGLAEDRDGRIWLATASGVSCYSPK